MNRVEPEPHGAIIGAASEIITYCFNLCEEAGILGYCDQGVCVISFPVYT